MKEFRQNFKLSPFTHFISLEGSQYQVLYNSLSMRLVVVNKEITPALRKGCLQEIDLATIKNLHSARIIILSERNDFEELKQARMFFQRKILGVLCLMLTEVCNLRCRYCFVEHKFPVNHVFRSLSKESAKCGIDVFIRHLPKSIKNGLTDPTISFYGGEPLLNSSVLKWVLQYISDQKDKGLLPENTFLTLNTNGTLITPKIVQLLKEYDVSVSVSVDGPQVIHDLARVDIQEKGSFEKVLHGISLLKEHGVDVGVSCAVAMHNLNHLEEITNWFIENLKLDVFGFNFLLEGGLNEPNFDISAYSSKISEKMVSCFKITRNKGRQEERTFRLARSFAQAEIHYYDCSGCGQQLVVDPNGRFGPCHAYIHAGKNFVASNGKIDLFSHSLWQEWKERSPLNMKQCQNCIALGICGGGCPYNAEIRKGAIWEIDEVFCSFAQSMVLFFIQEVAENVINDYKKVNVK